MSRLLSNACVAHPHKRPVKRSARALLPPKCLACTSCGRILGVEKEFPARWNHIRLDPVASSKILWFFTIARADVRTFGNGLKVVNFLPWDWRESSEVVLHTFTHILTVVFSLKVTWNFLKRRNHLSVYENTLEKFINLATNQLQTFVQVEYRMQLVINCFVVLYIC